MSLSLFARAPTRERMKKGTNVEGNEFKEDRERAYTCPARARVSKRNAFQKPVASM